MDIKINSLIETIRDNERIQNNFFEIEKTILKVKTVKDLVTTLLDELNSRFKLHYSGIVFVKDHIRTGDLNVDVILDEVKNSSSVIVHERLRKILKDNKKPILSDSNLRSLKDFFPENIIKEAGSVAIIPLKLGDTIIGSLNLADLDPARYNEDQSTFLLERLTTIISICVDNVLKHEQLKHLSMTDPLTGLANRRLAYQTIEKELGRSKRYENPLSILYIDLDDFKIINDTYGHDIGDLYLKHVSRLLKDECRDFDCVSRLGGDEFLIVLCNSSQTDSVNVQKRIHDSTLKNHFFVNDVLIPVKFSSGLASTDNTNINTVDALIKKADDELYSMKNEHKSKKRKAYKKAVNLNSLKKPARKPSKRQKDANLSY